MFEKCVCDLQIVHYTEFGHFFTGNIGITFCVFADVGREVVKFRIRFGLKSPPVITAFVVWNVLIIDYSFLAGCFRILQGGFEGRCVCTDNVGYDVIV